MYLSVRRIVEGAIEKQLDRLNVELLFQVIWRIPEELRMELAGLYLP